MRCTACWHKIAVEMDSPSPVDAGPTAWPRLQKFLATADVQLLRDWQQRQNMAFAEQRQQQVVLSERHEQQMRLLSFGRANPPTTTATITSITAVSSDVRSYCHPASCEATSSQALSCESQELRSDMGGITGSEETDLAATPSCSGSNELANGAGMASGRATNHAADLGESSLAVGSAEADESPERDDSMQHQQAVAKVGL